MISDIKLKFGATPDQPPLSIAVTPVTIFVGPNNSGKSKALQELEGFCRGQRLGDSAVILEKVTLCPVEKSELEAELANLSSPSLPNGKERPDRVCFSKVHPESQKGWRGEFHLPELVRQAQNPNAKNSLEYFQFLSLFTLKLDGTNRLTLLDQKDSGDLQADAPANSLAHLFLNDELRSEVRRIIEGAFGRFFVIDPTHIGKLRVRLSKRPPSDHSEERGLDDRAVEFHKAALLMSQASDGVKAFCGIISTILAGDPKITLIDEPEAFLHPSLSNLLGKEICKSLHRSSKRLFVSTHSSSFLMGCIQSGIPVNIVRLTYDFGQPTARLLPTEKLLPLMRHPLLRSTGVLNGLFYESVVVSESDADRAFYQEINDRLLADNDPRGIQNCLFLNAQGKHTVPNIILPLRELGIPCVGVVDIDIFKDPGKNWTKWLEAVHIPGVQHEPFHRQRQTIFGAFEATGRNFKRDGGIDLLSGAEREGCENFLGQLRDYGLFVVPHGELESWLPQLGASGHTPSWLIEAFEAMGTDPSAAGYTTPDNGDVWDFIGAIKDWVSNPRRKGIPAG